MFCKIKIRRYFVLCKNGNNACRPDLDSIAHGSCSCPMDTVFVHGTTKLAVPWTSGRPDRIAHSHIWRFLHL